LKIAILCGKEKRQVLGRNTQQLPTSFQDTPNQTPGIRRSLYSLFQRVIVWGLPPWTFPPVQREAFEWAASIPMPAIGATGTVLSFQVPEARNGTIVRIGNTASSGSFIDGGGGLIFQLLADGVPISNFENIVSSLGTMAAPSEVSSIEIRSNQLIQFNVINVSLPPSGQISARLGGWYYPQTLEHRGSFA
jgi:hypothetical protein